MIALLRSRCRCCGLRWRPKVLDISYRDAKPFDDADHLPFEVTIAVYLGWRDEELRLVPPRHEIEAQLRESDTMFEREALAADRDGIDPL